MLDSGAGKRINPQGKEQLWCSFFLCILGIVLVVSDQVTAADTGNPDSCETRLIIPPSPFYFQAGQMPLRSQRWKLIPESRRAEFSFGRRLFPFQEPEDPAPPDSVAWAAVRPGLQGSFVPIDSRWPRGLPPSVEPLNRQRLSGWKGERVQAQILLWSASEYRQLRWRKALFDGPGTLPEDCLKIDFVRYVLADDGSQGGRGAPPEACFLAADVLEQVERFDLPAGNVRPLWVTVDIPAQAKAGLYRMDLALQAENGVSLPFTVELEVFDRTLPPPTEWSFHLDLWQNPWAVARYHGIKPWSPEHWSLLRPLMAMLAEAGQKNVSTTIIARPWGGQTYDAYESMIDWIRQPDGSWRWDYTVFDRWVEFCFGLGINRAINCYSVISWSGYTFLDESTGELKTLSLKTGSQQYAEHWRPFLKDFFRHVKDKGWYERVEFAIDEAPLETMQQFISFLRADAPELKIALAGGYHPEIKEYIHNWCCFIDQNIPADVLEERRKAGRPTTYYVCCGPERPNTFTSSPPVESAWLGWYAAARGFDGFLRWAYNSWPLDPLADSRYIAWPSGDCFMVYPGARSSIRFERLREGIQDYEKLRILRRELALSTTTAARERLQRLESFLAEFKYDPATGPSLYLEQVRRGKVLMEELSR